jgi:acyl-CoA synthetase (AMP-forming)/AMP-acid ligase II
MTAGEQLARHARKIPDTPALRFSGVSQSYRDRRIAVVADLSRNASGKVLKTELRAKYSAPDSPI